MREGQVSVGGYYVEAADVAAELALHLGFESGIDVVIVVGVGVVGKAVDITYEVIAHLDAADPGDCRLDPFLCVAPVAAAACPLIGFVRLTGGVGELGLVKALRGDVGPVRIIVLGRVLGVVGQRNRGKHNAGWRCELATLHRALRADDPIFSDSGASGVNDFLYHERISTTIPDHHVCPGPTVARPSSSGFAR